MTARSSFLRSTRFGCSVVLALTASAWGLQAHAQPYPSKPIRLLVGYLPGGGVDFTARTIAPALGEALNTIVVVENKAGASGTLSGDFVAKSAPDGYTLLYAPGSAITTAPQTMAKPPFDVLNDLAPINMVGESPLVIAMNPNLGVHNVKDLLALSRKRTVNLASGGAGGMSHLTIEMLSQAAKGNITHVAYKGGSPAIVDTMAGHVDGTLADFPPVLQMFKDKRLVPVGVTSEKRVEFLPNVQTVAEDIPGFVALSWYGVFAPAKTPRDIIEKINAALVKAMAREDVRTHLKDAAVLPKTLASPAAFRTFVADDYARWGKLIRDRNIVATTQ
ncbi:tripartite tricarboxylate transporter substrate binding protein [Variovorax rhizosphaerae]|uniref:Tripartite tricarboxylate transporter substrate binding protein n=1 Tax=Variovorax rhizosphaerae TaxID=1836200 RepID=A0ABU8WTN2_9BURK